MRDASQTIDLKEYLEEYRTLDAPVAETLRTALAGTVLALADAALAIHDMVRSGPLSGALGADAGATNADGDDQKTLDVLANDAIVQCLRRASVACYASEEEEAIICLDADGLLGVAADPLDGSSNIDVNVSIGTIFSIFPANPDGATATFFRSGRDQLAAGYFIYGPHTALVLSLGQGVAEFVLDPQSGRFLLVRPAMAIAVDTKEFAINVSNYRHWSPPVRTFIDDCLAGAEGPRGKNFNMRWVASLVAETHRIFSRGGVFLYPGDVRPGYRSGRLRLLYEAFPIAFLCEQAGGAASDGTTPVLDRQPADLHERTPLFFGAARKIERIAAYHQDAGIARGSSPLFGQRSLFRT